MSLAFSLARNALQAQLTTRLPTLRVSAIVPPQVNPPALVVAPATGTLADYEQVISSDLVLWYMRIVLIVGRADDTQAQSTMDSLISTSGALSVPAAIRFDPTLGGQVEWAELKSADRYGNMSYNGVDFLGCELTVEVSC